MNSKKLPLIGIGICVVWYLLAHFAEISHPASPYGPYGAIVPGVLLALLLPGFLALALLNVKFTKASETILFSVGSSVFLLLAASLLVNTFLPLVHIPHPLASEWMIPMVLDLNALLLAGCVVKKRQLATYVPPITLRWRWAVLYAVPPLFTLCSILGARQLNSGGNDLIALLLLAAVAVYSAVLLLLHKRVPRSVYPFALYFIALAFLLALSLRGWIISGHDILSEYYVYRLTSSNLHWNISSFRDAYNACLSITLLPNVIHGLLRAVSGEAVFRVVFQAIFALMPVGLYQFVRRYLRESLAFLATLFFMSQSPFLRDFVFLTRQEIAIFFYMLILLVLTNRRLSKQQRRIGLAVFSACLVVSHYSTTYVVFAMFLLSLMLQTKFIQKAGAFIAKQVGRIPVLKIMSKLSRDHDSELLHQTVNPQQTNWLPGWKYVAFLFIIIFTWNTLLTHTSNNLTAFSRSAAQNITGQNGFRGKQTGPLDQFKLFTTSNADAGLDAQYAQKTKGSSYTAVGEHYPSQTYRDYNPHKDTPVSLRPKLNSRYTQLIDLVGELIKKSIKIFMLVGIVWLLFTMLGRKLTDKAFRTLMLANISVLLLAIALPVISIDYDLMRAYQQLLIILCVPTVVGVLAVGSVFKKRLAYLLTAALFVTYSLFISPFIPQVIGSGDAQLQLNNAGLYYNLYYMQQPELDAIHWLSRYGDPNVPVFSDWYSKKKITAFGNRPIWVIDNVLPRNITKDSYIYVSRVNRTEQTAYVFYQGRELDYRFPTTFLAKHKKVVYVNQDIEILK